MSKIRLTQVRSVIDRPKDQKDTVRRLGLHGIHDTVIKEDRPDVRGMVNKVRHLVAVEEFGEDAKRRGRGQASGEGAKPQGRGQAKSQDAMRERSDGGAR